MSRNTIPGEVRELTHELRRYSSIADFDGFMKCYADIPSFTAITADGACHTYREFKAICLKYYEGIDSQSFQTHKEEFYSLVPEIILSVWQGQIEAHYSDGRSMQIEDYAVSIIVAEIDGAWKIVHSHESGTSPQFYGDDWSVYFSLEDCGFLDISYAFKYFRYFAHAEFAAMINP